MTLEAPLEGMKDVRGSVCFENCETEFEEEANVVKADRSESEPFTFFFPECVWKSRGNSPHEGKSDWVVILLSECDRVGRKSAVWTRAGSRPERGSSSPSSEFALSFRHEHFLSAHVLSRH